MITIRNVKFQFTDITYHVECIEFIATLTVRSTDYDHIVKAIEDISNQYTNVRLLSFTL